MEASGAKRNPDEVLADLLTALGSASRLALLRQLRSPRILTEIRVKPPTDGAGEAPDYAAIARQTVKKHLTKLVEAGVVAAHSAEREFGDTVEYVVNHQRLFAISEELRALATLRPVVEPTAAPTSEDAAARPGRTPFPRLLLVRGLSEGQGFPLRPRDGATEAEWVIGRRRDADVPVDYDPYVSVENTRVALAGGAYSVEDLPQSRNGTTLNFEPIPKARRLTLHHGDVVGVGHTFFVFQTRDPRK